MNYRTYSKVFGLFKNISNVLNSTTCSVPEIIYKKKSSFLASAMTKRRKWFPLKALWEFTVGFHQNPMEISWSWRRWCKTLGPSASKMGYQLTPRSDNCSLSLCSGRSPGCVNPCCGACLQQRSPSVLPGCTHSTFSRCWCTVILGAAFQHCYKADYTSCFLTHFFFFGWSLNQKMGLLYVYEYWTFTSFDTGIPFLGVYTENIILNLKQNVIHNHDYSSIIYTNKTFKMS